MKVPAGCHLWNFWENDQPLPTRFDHRRWTIGVVFLARDQNSNEQVALKILDPQIASDDEQRQRFVPPMTTMLPIRHHRIIRLLNAGKSGPYCWIAMEYIDGDSLTKVIEKIGIEGCWTGNRSGVWPWMWDWHYNTVLSMRSCTQRPNTAISSPAQRWSVLVGRFYACQSSGRLSTSSADSPGEILGEPHYLASRANTAQWHRRFPLRYLWIGSDVLCVVDGPASGGW